MLNFKHFSYSGILLAETTFVMKVPEMNIIWLKSAQTLLYKLEGKLWKSCEIMANSVSFGSSLMHNKAQLIENLYKPTSCVFNGLRHFDPFP
jgi:hypothetical protein